MIKAVLAHVILQYDLKLGGDGARPSEVYLAMAVTPALKGRILFRERSLGGSI